MPLIDNADFLSSADMAPSQAAAWLRQRSRVASSPFYQALWGTQRLPDRLEDLPDLPLSDKSMLRASQAAHPPFGDYLATPVSDVTRLHRTSGTTGQAMNLALSAGDAHATAVVGGRAQRAAGLGPDHRVIHCLNYQMWMGGLTDHLTLEQTGALVVPFGVGNTRLLIETIQALKITAISCTPSYPAVLEHVIATEFPGLAPRDLGLRLGLFGGEAGLDDPALRARFEDVWGLAPRNSNYGVTDVFCNFAGQCEHDSDLHFVAADVLWPEIIDSETAQPLPLQAGTRGELVLTHLMRDCQPLVRFRTGDVLQITATDACSCGRTGFRFRVVGRSDDMVVVRGINAFPTMVAAVVTADRRLSGEYRIRLRGAGPYDVLPLEVELAPGLVPDPTIATDLVAALKRGIGVSAVITQLPHGALPRTEGKTRRVLREE